MLAPTIESRQDWRIRPLIMRATTLYLSSNTSSLLYEPLEDLRYFRSYRCRPGGSTITPQVISRGKLVSLVRDNRQ
jgi:hypothetical protein